MLSMAWLLVLHVAICSLRLVLNALSVALQGTWGSELRIHRLVVLHMVAWLQVRNQHWLSG
jgi:hypothetical protein